MKRTHRNILLGLALLITAAMGIRALMACGPSPGPFLIFSWARHPDLPLDRFAGGRVGILQPTFPRSYLVVAYRQLMGKPLTPEEQRGACELWRLRLFGGSFLDAKDSEEDKKDWMKAWEDLHASCLKGQGSEIHLFSQGRDEKWNFGVQSGAFKRATLGLQARINRWGTKDPRLMAWVRTQDQVFHSSQEHPDIPEALPETADAHLREDRAYQIAAAHFYANHIQEALPLFQAIAQQSTGTWKDYAAYMVAYCLKQEEKYEEAINTLHEDRNWPKELRWAGLCMKKTIHAVQNPEKRTRELASLLCRPGGTSEFGVDLGDYTILLDWQIKGELHWIEDPSKVRTIPEALLRDDLTDWVYSFRATGEGAYAHALKHWKTRKSTPWLVAALTNAGPKSQDLSELLEAAKSLAPSSAGYAMAAFHRARLLALLGSLDQAKALLDDVLSGDLDRWGASTVNLFRTLRMPLDRDLGSFVKDVQRRPTGAALLDSTKPSDHLEAAGRGLGHAALESQLVKEQLGITNTSMFVDRDGALALTEQLPLEVLAQAVASIDLPMNLQQKWLEATWVRAVLLERHDVALEMVNRLIRLEKDLVDPFTPYLKATKEARSREALWILLHQRSLNWQVWAGEGPDYETLGRRLGWWMSYKEFHEYLAPETYPTEMDEAPPFQNIMKSLVFLSEDQRTAAKLELDTLIKQGSGPLFLCRETLAWAKACPEDPRIPEALHLAVASSRVADTSPYQQRCFHLLHTRYARSEWAKETKYYY